MIPLIVLLLVKQKVLVDIAVFLTYQNEARSLDILGSETPNLMILVTCIAIMMEIDWKSYNRYIVLF